MATTISYTVSDFQPFTKILSADMNSRFQNLKDRINWDGSGTTTGLGDDNIQSNTVSGGGLTRASKLKAGTASHVVINDGDGKMSSEAQLATTRGGTGFNPTMSAANAGKAVAVNDAGTSFELRTPIADRLTLASTSDVSDITSGETIAANDAVCLALAKDSNNNDIYRVFKTDSDLGNRKRNFAGFATASASVVAHQLTWTSSADFVTGNVITYYINGRLYTTSFTTDNDTTLAAVATQIATDADIQSASAVDAGSSDRVINIVGKGGLQINITSAAVTGGASQPTITIATTQSPSGTAVNIRYFGPMGGFSSLTPGSLYYLSSTAGGITKTPADANPVLVGQALSSTVLLISYAFGGFLFGTSSVLVVSHGSTTSSPAQGTATTAHFDATSWTVGGAGTAARSLGQLGECVLGTNFVYVDGYNTSSAVTALTDVYNKTSFSAGSNRTTAKIAGGCGTLGSTMYVGKGSNGATVQTAIDSWNGSAWTNGVANLGTGTYGCAAFKQGAQIHWIAGQALTLHDTFDGSSVSTSTAYPAGTQTTIGSSAGVSGASGVVGGQSSGSTASYQWDGSSWSASIAMAKDINSAATGADPNGGASGYDVGLSIAYAAGGYSGSALTNLQKFNGTSWQAGTAMTTAKASLSGGVF